MSIIGLAVTLGALRADADEVAGSIVDVLRVGLLENPAGAIEEVGSLRDRCNVALREGRATASAMVDIALHPGVDGGSPAVEYGGSVSDADCNGDVSELYVVQDEGSIEMGARCAVEDEGRGVGDDGIDNGLCTDTLGTPFLGASLSLRDRNTNLARCCEIYRLPGVSFQTNLGVVDGDALKRPSPVPNGVNLNGG